jgi:hypothetical protein
MLSVVFNPLNFDIKFFLQAAKAGAWNFTERRDYKFKAISFISCCPLKHISHFIMKGKVKIYPLTYILKGRVKIYPLTYILKGKVKIYPLTYILKGKVKIYPLTSTSPRYSLEIYAPSCLRAICWIQWSFLSCHLSISPSLSVLKDDCAS